MGHLHQFIKYLQFMQLQFYFSNIMTNAPFFRKTRENGAFWGILIVSIGKQCLYEMSGF